MRAVAILSLHTSPLAQPGAGDGGGMNVYVRELSSARSTSAFTRSRVWKVDTSGRSRVCLIVWPAIPDSQ